MCFGSAYWARVKAVYYAATAKDAAEFGFDDAFIYDELKMAESDRKIVFKQINDSEDRLRPFKQWGELSGKVLY